MIAFEYYNYGCTGYPVPVPVGQISGHFFKSGSGQNGTSNRIVLGRFWQLVHPANRDVLSKMIYSFSIQLAFI